MVRFTRGKLLVLFLTHQTFQVLHALLIDRDLGNPPTTMRIVLGDLVDGRGLLLQKKVDVCNLAGHGSVDIGSALHGLDGANGVAGLENLPFLRQLDVDDVAEGFGGILADADDARFVVGREVDPLVVLGVLLYRVYGLPWLAFSFFSSFFLLRDTVWSPHFSPSPRKP